jgi:multiple antibiotic resistance protein
MVQALQYFGLAFSALLPVINPLGSALVLLGLVGPAPDEVFRKLARKIAFSTVLFLLVVELVGAAILGFFGISLPVVQLSGGLVLAAMGWGLLNEKSSGADKEQIAEHANEGSLEEKVFYPFTFPITVGPACIVVTLTLSAHAARNQAHAWAVGSILAHVGILAGILAVTLTVLLSYTYAPKITQKISPQTVHGILRVIAFVLLCIGVQIAWNGLDAMLRSVLQST